MYSRESEGSGLFRSGFLCENAASCCALVDVQHTRRLLTYLLLKYRQFSSAICDSWHADFLAHYLRLTQASKNRGADSGDTFRA